MSVLEYLGIAVICCAFSYLFERAYVNGSAKSKTLFYISALFFIPSFPVLAFFYECRRGIKKRAYEKQQKAAHTAAVIASIESLPEDLRENAWRSIAWHNFHSKLTYNEWCCQMFDEYDLPDEIFDSSFYPRSEIQRLRDELKREAPHA